MTKDEFEAWVKTLSPEQKEQAEGFFTVIRRGPDHQLKIVPYNEEYRGDLDLAGKLLRDAAALTDNDSLKKFLTTRADAFSSNNYYDSDMAWMDLDAPVDVTFGPYETYLDEIFGYKAAFEAYINVRDDKETARLAFLGKHLQEIEDNLPEDPQYRNSKLGALAPIRVVNEIFSAGDGNHGIATAAYNLPNDDKVVQQKGSKRVMLKNIQEAKFHATLIPISRVVLSPADQKYLSFDLFFTHIVAHELCHGLGPHQIKIQGRDTNPRMELKEQYAAWEEAKADVTGLFALQYLMTQADHGKITMPLPHGPEAERKLYTTYLASSFRTMRFGLQDAHARGQAMQFNFFLMKGAYIPNADGTFSLDLAKMKDAVVELDKGLLTAGSQRRLQLRKNVDGHEWRYKARSTKSPGAPEIRPHRHRAHLRNRRQHQHPTLRTTLCPQTFTKCTGRRKRVVASRKLFSDLAICMVTTSRLITRKPSNFFPPPLNRAALAPPSASHRCTQKVWAFHAMLNEAIRLLESVAAPANGPDASTARIELARLYSQGLGIRS